MIQINELFRSIQGEGLHAGRMMQFVRFFGCNLDCSWCDQPDALTTRPQHHYRDMEAAEIAQVVTENHISVPVCITGGEPTFQRQGLIELWSEIRIQDDDRHNEGDRLITIETNGTGYVNEISSSGGIFISCSPKFLNVQTDGRIKAHGESDVIQWINSLVPMQLKFVVESAEMFEKLFDWSCRVVPKSRRRAMPLIFQPEWFKGKADFKTTIQKYSDPQTYDRLAKEGFKSVTFQPQAHKLLAIH